MVSNVPNLHLIIFKNSSEFPPTYFLHVYAFARGGASRSAPRKFDVFRPLWQSEFQNFADNFGLKAFLSSKLPFVERRQLSNQIKTTPPLLARSKRARVCPESTHSLVQGFQ